MILHIDLDCFFVAAERIKDPNLRGKCVAVVGSGGGKIFDIEDAPGGVVVSASYEARKFGVKSAQPLFLAQRNCAGLIVVKTDHEFYKKLSSNLHKFLLNFTPDIEKFSIDEFFLDLKGTKFEGEEFEFAKWLQKAILSRFELPCSIGISEGKGVAKLSTDLAKPFGVKMTKIRDLEREIGGVDIAKFPGVGAKTLKFLNSHGIFTISHALKSEFVFANLGKNGLKLYNSIIGSDRNIEKNAPAKNISMARTFPAVSERDEIRRRMMILCRHISFEVLNLGLNPTKFAVKIRYIGKNAISHSCTMNREFSEISLRKIALSLLEKCDEKPNLAINYISLTAGGFENYLQKSVFSDARDQNINESLQKIREKYGVELIKSAKEIE